MNRFTRILALWIAFPATAMAGTAAGSGILGTMHDFASGTDPGNQYAATQTKKVGLCTFCHTPHSAQSTSLLWNHTLSTNSYTWDTATTASGTPYPTNLNASYLGPTLKCLSCHDGSVAIGDVSNYLGKKAVYNTYQVAAGAGQIGTNGDLTGNHQLGNLTGNHPIGMPYPYGGAANTYNGITDNTVNYTDFVPNPEASTTAHIKLFNYNSTNGSVGNGGSAGISGMECSSCHDPHNKAAVDVSFLRGKLGGSQASDGYLCAQCHVK
ncbi:MAG: hypothetical protein ACHP7O_09680 [Burkholderiales bacterium]